jgi:hypothetical protein
MITLDNPKLYSLLEQREVEFKNINKVLKELNILEIKIKRLEEKEKMITSKTIPPKELIEKGDTLVKQITDMNKEVVKIADQIEEFKLNAIPKEIKEQHQQLMKEREEKERERNIIALKVQKFRDKYIPLIRKEVKPMLKEFEDIESAQIKNGKILIPVFDRLEEFKRKFRRN